MNRIKLLLMLLLAFTFAAAVTGCDNKPIITEEVIKEEPVADAKKDQASENAEATVGATDEAADAETADAETADAEATEGEESADAEDPGEKTDAAVEVPQPTEVVQIDKARLAELAKEDDIIVLNVCNPDETVPGLDAFPPEKVMNIPVAKIAEGDFQLDMDKRYAVVCRSGGRSKSASMLLSMRGYTVFNLQGGMIAE